MPHISYLSDYQPLPCSPNSNNIVQAIEDTVTPLGTDRNSFCLLSDAARHVTAAGTVLKSIYPNYFMSLV